jgi:hypothetical protein
MIGINFDTNVGSLKYLYLINIYKNSVPKHCVSIKETIRLMKCRELTNCLKYEVLTAVNIEITLFFDVTP